MQSCQQSKEKPKTGKQFLTHTHTHIYTYAHCNFVLTNVKNLYDTLQYKHYYEWHFQHH